MSTPPATSSRSTPTASATVASAVTTHPILGVFGVLFGAMISKFAGQLLSVGLADLRGALHLGVDNASWLGTAFNAAMMFIGPVSVYLGGLFGVRRVLLTCGALFTLISVLLPFSGSLPIMLALLVLAGLTAGTFYPLTLSIVLRNLPIKYVLLGIAMYAMDVVVSLNIATSLEAWYMDHLSWHWIFWNSAVLTPVMMVLIYFGIPWQPLPKPKEGQPKLSWQGFFYVGLGFTLLYIALAQGQRLNWMNSATIIALVVTGLFLLLVAVVGHLRLRHRLINFKFLMRRNTLLLGLTVVFFEFDVAGDALFATKLSRIRQRLSPTANRAGDALGRPASVHLRATCNVSAEVHRRPADPDCRLHSDSDRLPDERAPFLSMVGRQLLAFAGGHVRWSGARHQRFGGRHHT